MSDAVERAVRALNRPGAWLDAAGEGAYLVRTSADRRRRASLCLDETDFAALTRDPGLRARLEGGWRLARAVTPASAPPAGRPSLIEGRRLVTGPDGRTATKAVNLGESPIAWLARRRDARGRPWLTLVEVAAAEKLRDDFVVAGTVGRLTMAWDAGPKARGGRGPGVDPAERARAAKDRIARALADVGPGLKDILEHVCFAGTALEAAERSLGLPRRAGKALLKLALGRLAAHYGLG
ncbi:MAG: DUF6456 domain-containing protein [Caulobacter sp.]|nr:DUF6456 domain-containing protein [Caulobacter sp.]